MEIVNDNYKYYLPSNYINNTYNYVIQDEYIIVNKNTNCYSQYNSTYCDCFRIYPSFNYLSSNTYSCSVSNNYTVSYNSFSSDIFNSPFFVDYFLIYFIIIFICTYILKLLLNVFRKRTV